MVILMDWVHVLFVLKLSLLLLHEMDAVRAREWKMFIFLKSMREETAYIIFSVVHLPLYFWALFTISQTFSSGYTFVYLITDVFLIAHTVIHFFFRRHAANGFSSAYSNALIYIMGVLAVIHLILII